MKNNYIFLALLLLSFRINPAISQINTDSVIISGIISTLSGIELGGVRVNLISDLGQYPTFITDGDGKYEFTIVPDSTIQIIPERLDNPRNGISTLDLVALHRHLLNRDTLDSPYQLIAADANNSQSVSAIDIVVLKKLILGIYADFPNNKSWRFVFPSIPSKPLQFAEEILFDGSKSATYNFTGIKIGDVNGSIR